MKFRASVIAALILGAGTVSAHAATQPAKGIYSVLDYVQSANATNGGTCPTASPGSYLSGVFTYPGAAATGAVERLAFAGSGYSLVQNLTFPKTPNSGVPSWSGAFSSTFLPGGSPGSGTFQATYTFIDASSFDGLITYTFATGGGSVCTTTFRQVFIRTGT